jgi:hypothetical protein
LVDFFLFVFIYVLKLRLLKGELAVLVLAECVGWHGRDSLAVLSYALLLLFGFLLELLYLFFLLLDLPEPALELENCLAFFPDFDEFSALTHAAKSAEFDGLFI